MDRLTNPQNFDADLEMAILEGLTEILEDEEDVPRKKHHKKVNAFIGDSDDDDIIDYDSDDPEDEDLDVDEEDTNEDDYSDDDLDDADDNELDDGIEGQLSELHQDDLDDDDE